MVGHLDRRKTTSACLFTFAKRVISWQSKIIQKFVSLPTNTKPEFNMVTKVGKEMFWMKMFVLELVLNQLTCVIFYDSQSAMYLSKNSDVYHSRMRYHWLPLTVEDQLIQLKKIHIDENVANMLNIDGL